jgi:uncharacterized protein (DUF302 family)
MSKRTTSDGAVTHSTTIQHTRVATGLSYDALISAFERELGHLDPSVPQHLIKWKAAWSEVEREIGEAAGRHGLMIIARADQGPLLSLSGSQRRCTLYIVGNPLIARKIIDIDVRGGFYVPFRVALYDDGGPGGAVIAFDRPSSFLATLGHPELAEIGQSLDGKIDAVVAAIRTR